MQDFVIRPLTSQDEPFLWEALYFAIYVPDGVAPPPRNIVEEPKLAHYVRHWGQAPGDLGVIVEANDPHRPVGAAWLRQLTHLDPGYGYVDDRTPELTIALLPGYRGIGLGSRLLDELLQAAQAKFEAVSLSVSFDNRARALYERLGFVTVGGDESSLTMLKRLR